MKNCDTCKFYKRKSQTCSNKNSIDFSKKKDCQTICDEYSKRDILDNAFAQYGTFGHKIFEEYANGKLEVYEMVDKFKDEFSSKVTMKFPKNKYCNLQDSYFADGINCFTEFDGLDDYEILGAEDEFLENINDDFNLKGYIDLILKDADGKIIVQDHKSKAKFINKKEQYAYARQLYLYSYRIYKKYGEYPNILRFNMFRKQLVVDIPFNKIDFDESMEWMQKTVTGIRTCNDFPHTYNQFMCNNLCNHRKTCEYKKAVEKKAVKRTAC